MRILSKNASIVDVGYGYIDMGMQMKRVTIATLSGVFFGFVCFGLAASSPGTLPLPVVLQIIASRTLIGFAIGISSLSLIHWCVHGLFMGLLFSLPLGFSGLIAPDNPELPRQLCGCGRLF